MVLGCRNEKAARIALRYKAETGEREREKRKLDDISRNDQILLPIERGKFAVHLPPPPPTRFHATSANEKDQTFQNLQRRGLRGRGRITLSKNTMELVWREQNAPTFRQIYAFVAEKNPRRYIVLGESSIWRFPLLSYLGPKASSSSSSSIMGVGLLRVSIMAHHNFLSERRKVYCAKTLT